MISNELKSLLIQVITSWQVIAVSVALVLYFSLVFYVARFSNTVKIPAMPKPKPKPKKENKPEPKSAEDDEEVE
ncbi:MAG: hypothetical protein LBD55_10585 [Treponema sp.]|jgi:hypothetical protein|nr:hypothetical protein [Treponema sp.]